MEDEIGGDTKNSDDSDEVEEFGERIGDETERKDLREVEFGWVDWGANTGRKKGRKNSGRSSAVGKSTNVTGQGNSAGRL